VPRQRFLAASRHHSVNTAITLPLSASPRRQLALVTTADDKRPGPNQAKMGIITVEGLVALIDQDITELQLPWRCALRHNRGRLWADRQ
jgi:hypothetical protein